MKLILKKAGGCVLVLLIATGMYAKSNSAPPVALSGILSTNIKAGSGPFLVTGDLTVPPGTTVTIGAGTVFLFDNFSGLHIQGTLVCRGKKGKPVVFTSKNDHSWNPNAAVDAAPFDWNGIDIYPTAGGVSFEECMISYSVYGIKSQTDRFQLTRTEFAENGRCDLSINGNERMAGPGPFSYGLPALKPVTAIKASAEDQRKFAYLRYPGLALAVGGAVVGTVALIQYPGAVHHFDQVNNPDAPGSQQYTAADWDKAKKSRDLYRGLLIGGWGSCAAGIMAVAVSFRF